MYVWVCIAFEVYLLNFLPRLLLSGYSVPFCSVLIMHPLPIPCMSISLSPILFLFCEIPMWIVASHLFLWQGNTKPWALCLASKKIYINYNKNNIPTCAICCYINIYQSSITRQALVVLARSLVAPLLLHATSFVAIGCCCCSFLVLFLLFFPFIPFSLMLVCTHIGPILHAQFKW